MRKDQTWEKKKKKMGVKEKNGELHTPTYGPAALGGLPYTEGDFTKLEKNINTGRREAYGGGGKEAGDRTGGERRGSNLLIRDKKKKVEAV